MASGYYPLDAKYDEGGRALADVADRLTFLLKERGDYGKSPLPAAWDNDQYDNAASDGGYETYLYLALELIERCIKRPKQETQPERPGEATT
jgi:hypothetical protein